MKPAHTSASVIALHRIDIPTPCTASWAAMAGDERVRHCGDCNKNVFNLSAMGEAEAAALIATNDGSLCVRFYRRQDGTVMTSDCSTSVRAATRRTLRRLPAAAGVALLAISVSAAAASDDPPAPKVQEAVQPVLMMGAPPPPPPEREKDAATKQPVEAPVFVGRVRLAESKR